MNKEERQALRDSLRQARLDLNPDEQSAAAQNLHDLVAEQDFFMNASHIAVSYTHLTLPTICSV